MTGICTYAPTTKLQQSDQYLSSVIVSLSLFQFSKKISETIVSNVVYSPLSNKHNSPQYMHNSTLVEDIPSTELAITACEDHNMPKVQNLTHLDQIATLKDNWNGYDAKAFSKELVEKCKDIISALELQPKIFPTGRQSIQFQYELEDRSYLEFEIFEKEILCLEVPKRIYSNAQTSKFPISEITKVKEIVKKFYEQNSGAK